MDFSQTTGRGNPNALFRAVEAMRRHQNDHPVDAEELRQLALECAALIPSEDDDWTPDAALAESAASAVVYALRTHLSGSASDAFAAGYQVYDAADFQAVNMLDVDFNARDAEGRVEATQIVQAALTAIEDDITAAESGL
jgi:uncharacterized protein (DUF2267 family)